MKRKPTTEQKLRKIVREIMREKVISEMNEDENPCWKGYEQIGMKMKDGKKVPNCVPTTEQKLRKVIRRIIKEEQKVLIKEDLQSNIVQQLNDKYDFKDLDSDNFNAIKTALLNTKDSDLVGSPIYDKITRSRTFSKALASKFSGKDVIRFYLTPDNIVFAIARIQLGRNDWADILYHDGEYFSGWGTATKEDHFIKRYPQAFTDEVWHVYKYSDPYKGIGNAGTVKYVKAKTENEARRKAKATGQGYGAEKVDPNKINELIKQWQEKVYSAMEVLNSLKMI